MLVRDDLGRYRTRLTVCVPGCRRFSARGRAGESRRRQDTGADGVELWRYPVHQYQTMPGVRVPAYLFLPERLPAPAILAPPGHGNGINDLAFNRDSYFRGYAHELARRGFVVLAPEHIGFGERVMGTNDGSHGFFTGAAQLLGFTMYGVFVRELERALDVLAALPEVDANRIGCYGISLGGATTLLLAALDERVRAAGVSGFFGSFRASFLDVAHCPCGNVQELALHFEHVDLAALVAPRPLLVEIGRADTGFPYDEALASLEELRALYALCDAESRLGHELHDGGHVISGRVAYDWFTEQLAPAGSS